MENVTTKHAVRSGVSNWYMYLSVLASIPVWWAIHTFAETINVHDDEVVATVATASFFAGLFTGRYISQIWILRFKHLSEKHLIIPAMVIVACSVWIFFHADFPLRGRPALNLMLYWLPFVVLSISFGILIKMIRSISGAELRSAQALAAQSKSELHVLQSQISPHFLFNTLNNMYGLSLTQHEKVPPLLLKLSELLRYSVYDANELFVPLKNEVDYIRNYIEFEKIRMGERLTLGTDIENVRSEEVKIAPMLLIVFIENAFKHSRNSADKNVYIELSLKTWGNKILFSIKNSYHENLDQPALISKHSGFGLESVRKRLEILYRNEHELSITNVDDTFLVLLQLNMK